MKIYLLASGGYSDYSIHGAFSTRERAEAAVAEMEKEGDEPWVEEYEVDELVSMTYGEFWVAHIDRESGEVHAYVGDDWGFRHPKAARIVDEDNYISVYSPISSEHAVKVATEKRQEWLRSRAIAPARGDRR